MRSRNRPEIGLVAFHFKLPGFGKQQVCGVESNAIEQRYSDEREAAYTSSRLCDGLRVRAALLFKHVGETFGGFEVGQLLLDIKVFDSDPVWLFYTNQLKS